MKRVSFICFLMYLGLQVTNAQTLMDKVEVNLMITEADKVYLMITDAEEQYGRVDQRLQTNSEKFQTLLTRGFQNNSLLAENKRDQVYIDLSSPLISKLSCFKAYLKQILLVDLNNVNDSHFKEVLTEAQISEMLAKAQVFLDVHTIMIEEILIGRKTGSVSVP